jgi:DNA-binding MarR family transcriptional regulator
MQQAIGDPGVFHKDAPTDPVTTLDLVVGLRDLIQRSKRLHGSVDAVERGAIGLLAHLAVIGEVRGSDLAHVVCLDASTVSRHLRSLESAGYITRRPDPADARAALIGISDSGRAVLDTVIADRVTTFDRATERWSDDDRTTLTRLIRRLADDLENL